MERNQNEKERKRRKKRKRRREKEEEKRKGGGEEKRKTKREEIAYLASLPHLSMKNGTPPRLATASTISRHLCLQQQTSHGP